MAATIKDIAKKTGLGLATISSYLNGGNVREKNRIKIEQAIEELHFEVNEVARGLRTNNTKTIGVVIPELTMVFCAQIVTVMEDILRNHGYAVIVCDCRTDKKREREAIEFLLHKRVDGLINLPVDKTGENIRLFEQSGKPLVLVDREIEGCACDSVLADNRMAAAQAVELFVSQGHREIGLIVGPQDIRAAKERKAGYLEALRRAGLPVREEYIYYGQDDMNSGVEGIQKLHREHPEITGVFVANHAMTTGAVIGMNEQNIRMGEELSLIGFDNLQFARACNPQLTIVAQPTEKIAECAARKMLAHLKDGGVQSGETERLQTQIVMGKSIRSMKEEEKER